MRTHRRFLLAFGGMVTGAAAVMTAAAYAGLTWNVTPSYPRGLWRIASRTWEKGDLVLVDAPHGATAFATARARGYLPGAFASSGCAPLLKRVVAVGGDTVEIDGDVSVNGRHLPNSTIRQSDSAGRPLWHQGRAGVIPSGFVWVMSEQSVLSFDSRYFGAIPARLVRGRAELLWAR